MRCSWFFCISESHAYNSQNLIIFAEFSSFWGIANKPQEKERNALPSIAFSAVLQNLGVFISIDKCE